MPIFGAVLSFLGTAVSSFFGFKGDQAKTVQSALEVLKSVNDTDAQSQVAAAQAIQSILTQGSWLEKQWRPVLMCLLIIIIGAWFFGYVPPHFNDPISPMMEKVINLLMIGIGGYIPCRTLEKIMQQFNIASILKNLINKKLT